MLLEKFKECYNQNPQLRPRLDTDKLFSFQAGTFKFNDLADKYVRFTTEHQLKDRKLWAIFTEQFKLGNVDDEDYGWRGEYWGKTMRGACLTYSYTKDLELYLILEKSVTDLLSCQDALGRITTYTVKNEYHGWDMWTRKYVALGLLYFYEICTDSHLKNEIISSLEKHFDYIIATVGSKDGLTSINDTSDVFEYFPVNSVSILEPLMRLYNLTEKSKYLEFAEYLINNDKNGKPNIFKLALENSLPLAKWPVRKAYEMISCFEGLLEYYRVTKQEKWLKSVLNFASLILKDEITIIGSCGCESEFFDGSAATQTFTKNTEVAQETCVTVTWMKFCHQLLCLTGDPIFADELEKSIYNALYSSINTNLTKPDELIEKYDLPKSVILPFDSYSPLLADKRGRAIGGIRRIADNTFYYGCCAAIGAAGVALAPLSASQVSHKGIAINLYFNGKMQLITPNNQDLTIRVETEYPKASKIAIKIELENPEEFEIKLRIPSFSKHSHLEVNGEKTPTSSGGFASLNKLWKNNDVILLDLDMNPHVIHPIGYEPDENSIYNIAVQYGPLVLARDRRLNGNQVGTPVDLKYSNSNIIDLKQSNSANFNVFLEFEVPEKNGNYIKMIDYQSAGKTLNDESFMEAWMPTKKY